MANQKTTCSGGSQPLTDPQRTPSYEETEVMLAASGRSSGSATAITYEPRVGTSVIPASPHAQKGQGNRTIRFFKFFKNENAIKDKLSSP